jgi:hypothetical protein
MTSIIFTAALRVDSKFLYLALANLYTMLKNRSYRVVELCASLAIVVGFQFFAVSLKGSHMMGGGRNSLKISAPLPLIKIK